MEGILGSYYWIRVALLAVLVLLSIVLAVRLMRARRFSMGRGLAVAAAGAVLLAGLWSITGSAPGIVWVVALLAIGAVLGFVAGKTARPAAGRPDALRRSPFAPVITALALIFAGMTLLFGSSYLFALSLLGISLAAGCLVGQVLGESTAAGSARRAAAAGRVAPG